MADVLATLFRFQQFIFEFGPYFLATWLGLAVIRGLTMSIQRQGGSVTAIDDPYPSRLSRYRPWVWRALLSWLEHVGEGKAASLTLSGLFLFSLAASAPALVVTSLIGMKAVWLRLILAALYALSLGRLLGWATSGKRGAPRGQLVPGLEAVSPRGASRGEEPGAEAGGLRYFTRVTWESLAGQVDRALIPLVIGFAVASAVTIFVPAYRIGPWLGEGAWQGPYLAALLVTPLQLIGGAEVPLAAALLVKGATLGAALSAMLASSGTTLFVIRRLTRATGIKATALYLVAVWLVAGSLGAAIDGLQRLMGG